MIHLLDEGNQLSRLLATREFDFQDDAIDENGGLASILTTNRRKPDHKDRSSLKLAVDRDCTAVAGDQRVADGKA